MLVETSSHKHIKLESRFAEGGEAVLWSVDGYRDRVAKIFHAPTAEKEAKLITMVEHQPSVTERLAVAWPEEMLFQKGTFVGYLMPRVRKSVPIFHMYNPARRRQLDAEFHPVYPWPYVLHHMAKNLAAAVKQIHNNGHVIGDLNESNVLVDQRAIVSLVDADSFQIHDPNGKAHPSGRLALHRFFAPEQPAVHRTVVGKAEFTAPELQGIDFKTVVRTPEQDNFALGVLIFYMLMGGYHPYAGILYSGESVARVDLHCMRKGVFPYTANLSAYPPPGAPPYYHLHPEIQMAFYRCFVLGHGRDHKRPSAAEWLTLLDNISPSLVSCPQDRNHIFYNHLSGCPTCDPDVEVQPGLDRVALIHRLWEIRLRIVAALTWLTQRGVEQIGVGWQGLKERVSAKRLLDKEAHRTERPSFRLVDIWRSICLRWSSAASLPMQVIDGDFDLGEGTILWLQWSVRSIVGLVLALLLTWVANQASVYFGQPMSFANRIIFATFLVGIGEGLAQWPLLKRRILPRTSRIFGLSAEQRQMVSWTVGSSLVLLMGVWGAERFFDLSTNLSTTEGASLHLGVYCLLVVGLMAGLVQSTWLRRHFQRASDQRLWTGIFAAGWLLAGYGYFLGMTTELSSFVPLLPDILGRLWLSRSLADGLLGLVAGRSIGFLLTGITFVWLARGPHQARGKRRFWLQLPSGETVLLHLKAVGSRWLKVGLTLLSLVVLMQGLVWWVLSK